jgi:hypothetical protein
MAHADALIEIMIGVLFAGQSPLNDPLNRPV